MPEARALVSHLPTKLGRLNILLRRVGELEREDIVEWVRHVEDEVKNAPAGQGT